MQGEVPRNEAEGLFHTFVTLTKSNNRRGKTRGILRRSLRRTVHGTPWFVPFGKPHYTNFDFAQDDMLTANATLCHRDVRSQKLYVILSEVELLRAARAASKKRYRKQNINVYIKH